MADYLRGKRILAVDDEQDVLDTIADLLDHVELDTARDYDTASRKLRTERYDLAILDIMGVNGMALLEEAVARQIPAVMLTAHAINAETLFESIHKGALSYLPKETLAELDTLLNDLFGAFVRGEPTWKLLFERLGGYFDERFGADWQRQDREFWTEFSRTYHVSKGIQARVQHDARLLGRGI